MTGVEVKVKVKVEVEVFPVTGELLIGDECLHGG